MRDGTKVHYAIFLTIVAATLALAACGEDESSSNVDLTGAADREADPARCETCLEYYYQAVRYEYEFYPKEDFDSFISCTQDIGECVIQDACDYCQRNAFNCWSYRGDKDYCVELGQTCEIASGLSDCEPYDISSCLDCKEIATQCICERDDNFVESQEAIYEDCDVIFEACLDENAVSPSACWLSTGDRSCD